MFGGGRGGEAAVEGAIFIPSISLKNITHCQDGKKANKCRLQQGTASIQSHLILHRVVLTFTSVLVFTHHVELCSGANNSRDFL